MCIIVHIAGVERQKYNGRITDSACLFQLLKLEANFDWFLIQYWNCDSPTKYNAVFSRP